MNLYKKLVIPSFIILIAIILLFDSCKKEDEIKQPKLPPEAILAIDFSNFNTQNKTINETKSINNWTLAATSTGLWSWILGVTLYVPVTSYKIALLQTPSQISDNMWLWSYNVNLGADTYQANLYGIVSKNNIEWEMYITKTSGTIIFSDFLWITGTMNIDGTYGQWIVNKSQLEPRQFFQIDWESDKSRKNYQVKYTIIDNDDQNVGNNIQFTYTKASELNAYLSVYNQKVNNTVEIYWDMENKAGKVKSENFYRNNLWHYWDSNLNDMQSKNN